MNAHYAPSYALIRAHFGLGLLGLLCLAAGLLLNATDVGGFFFQPLLLGLVHLCVLGWLMPIAIGAMHQLIPVVFEVPVRSEKLAWAAYALYVASAVPFIERMWTQQTDLLLAVSGTGMATAVWIYCLNLLATLRASQVRTLTGAYVVAAIGYLLFATGLGAMLAWNLYQPYLPVNHLFALRVHSHAAGVGFFGLLVMGVAYRLLEMFLLSHGARKRAGWVAFGAMNAGLWVLLFAFWYDLPRWTVGSGIGLLALGIGAFLLQIRAIYVRRMRKTVEVAWLHTSASWLYLVTALSLGAVAALAPLRPELWDRLTVIYGFVALPGFIGSIVMGQLYKIAPFLAWLHRFSRFVGLRKLPTASELLSEKPKLAQWALMHAGLLAFALGLLLDLSALKLAGAVAFAGSAVLFAGNILAIDRRRP